MYSIFLLLLFVDITRSSTLPEEASIHTAEMTAIKMAMKEIKKRELNIHRLAELNARHREPSNNKSDL